MVCGPDWAFDLVNIYNWAREMSSDSPNLSALLSQTFVAFAIEIDNEAEHRMPHFTTNQDGRRKSKDLPWLTSMAMWWNCLRFVPDEGITVREMESLARTKTNLPGMIRWGFVNIEPRPTSTAANSIKPNAVVHLRPAGKRSKEVWTPLFAEIEDRWRARFGSEEIDRLRELLRKFACQYGIAFPDCMPILGYGLFCTRDLGAKVSEFNAVETELPTDMALHALLAKALLAFARDYEAISKVSLAIAANVLRTTDPAGTPIRDLPALSGVSKESIAMATGYLVRHRFATEETGRVLRLNSEGLKEREHYFSAIEAIENDWRGRFGTGELRELLLEFSGPGPSLLFKGMEPYPDNWRAAIRKPACLPHFPMVLHRGGYPDGS